MKRKPEILRQGTWFYGEQRQNVWLVRQDWDFYEEEFHEGGPDLGPDGFAYYLLYGLAAEFDPGLGRSRTFLSEEDALAQAPTLLSGVVWAGQQG